MTMLQEAPINSGEKLPAGEVIYTRLGQLATEVWEDYQSVTLESGIMNGDKFEDFKQELGATGLRVGVVCTALRSFESVDSETGEVHILGIEDAIENLISKQYLDRTHENRYSLAVSLIDNICADVIEKPAEKA